MKTTPLITRRAAIKDMGKAGLAIIVFGAACSERTGQPSTTTPPPGSTTTSIMPTTTASRAGATQWARVEMAIVSAYILFRDGEAALVDTGQSGAGPDIEAALAAVGLGWEAVGHVIITHRHPDHVGSIDAVASSAPDASLYIGAGDASVIEGELVERFSEVADGDRVFDLEIVGTPGHTPGHVSVIDEEAGILVSGDALNNRGGNLNSASADVNFTEDGDEADESVRKLASRQFEVVLFGHGEPILQGGSEAVAELARGLP